MTSFMIVSVLTGRADVECNSLLMADLILADRKRADLFIAVQDGTMLIGDRSTDTPLARYLETSKWVELMR